jgi:hypothetical protein
MRLALAQQGLQNAIAHLSSCTQTNNTLIIAADRTISWTARDTGIIKGVYYPLEYQHLLDRHQYSLLLSDGSFFQFFYRFDQEDSLEKARLAFYPKPIPTLETVETLMDAAENALDREDEALYEHLYNWTELLDIGGKTPSNTSHIRFDFDRGANSHSQSHLQLSGVHELRVPADFYPQPLAFVQLCENLLPDIQPLEHHALGFERNNVLALNSCPELISLSGAK